MIELDRASVSAVTADGDVTILAPTTLQLTERRISIIGENGSGKSTLARLLNGLILPSAGAVRVCAQDGHTWLDTRRDGARVRQLVGFAFTDPAAQLVMPTAVEDIALSLRRVHAKKPDRLAAAHEVLAEFGLSELADRSVHTLSGGQKQLLAMAAVLATHPAILVADEPTTLLDLRNSLRIQTLLSALSQQLIVVTHDLTLAAQTERTLVVQNAQVVFDGSPETAINFYRNSVNAPGNGS